MRYYAVIDTSAFIWDRNAYEQNATPYYDLANQLVTFIDIFETEKPSIYLSNVLLEEIIKGFPCDLESNIPNFLELINSVFNFLSHLGNKITEFEREEIIGLYSKPSIIYQYYNKVVKKEIVYLISSMHSCDILIIYFTFDAIWSPEISLKTILKIGKSENVKEYETIIHPSNNQLRKFFDRLKPLFEHHPKHDRIKGWRIKKGKEVAPFSCFDGKDVSIPQNLLSTAFKFENKLYNYDNKNKTFIVFRSHHRNKYHGFDERLENVPFEVKRHFHKR